MMCRNRNDRGGNWPDHETTHEVIERERDTFTGVYNADGEPLHKPRKPIGFMRD